MRAQPDPQRTVTPSCRRLPRKPDLVRCNRGPPRPNGCPRRNFCQFGGYAAVVTLSACALAGFAALTAAVSAYRLPDPFRTVPAASVSPPRRPRATRAASAPFQGSTRYERWRTDQQLLVGHVGKAAGTHGDEWRISRRLTPSLPLRGRGNLADYSHVAILTVEGGTGRLKGTASDESHIAQRFGADWRACWWIGAERHAEIGTHRRQT